MSILRTIVTLTLIGVLLVTGVIVFAQQPPKDNSIKIRELRAEIKKREETNIPADLRELNLSILIERRAQLRTALRTEIDGLKKRRAELGSFVTPEEDQKIAASVQEDESEIHKLSDDMQSDLAVTSKGQTNVSRPVNVGP